MKECVTCERSYLLTDFNLNRGRRDGTCKWCRRVYQELYYEANPAKRAELLFSARRRNQRATERRHDEHAERLAEQGGGCAICGATANLDGGHAERKMPRDHCHKTGLDRAILCAACNYGLGCFKDNPERLEAAAAYIRRWVILHGRDNVS